MTIGLICKLQFKRDVAQVRCGLDNIRRAQGPPSQFKTGTIWRHVLHFISGSRSSSVSSQRLAREVHLERFAIIGSALNIKSAAECTCMVLFGANQIQSRMMSSALQCPAKVMAMIRNSLHIYGVYTRSAIGCTSVTQTNVSTLAKGAYLPSSSQGIRLRFPNIWRSWTVRVHAYCTADKKKKMLVWYLTIVVF